MENESCLGCQVGEKWRKKRGSLIMALHEIQGVKGYVDWKDAMDLATTMGVPLARIYEVLTFYNFLSLLLPERPLFRFVRVRLAISKAMTRFWKNSNPNLKLKRVSQRPTICSICSVFAVWAVAVWHLCALLTAKHTAV